MKKMNDDMKFIRAFSQITMTKICDIENINRSTLMSNRYDDKTIRKARERIESEIASLYIKRKPKRIKERKNCGHSNTL